MTISWTHSSTYFYDNYSLEVVALPRDLSVLVRG
jgi:hypothetical protein